MNIDMIEFNLSVPGFKGYHENILIKSFQMSPHLMSKEASPNPFLASLWIEPAAGWPFLGLGSGFSRLPSEGRLCFMMDVSLQPWNQLDIFSPLLISLMHGGGLPCIDVTMSPILLFTFKNRWIHRAPFQHLLDNFRGINSKLYLMSYSSNFSAG